MGVTQERAAHHLQPGNAADLESSHFWSDFQVELILAKLSVIRWSNEHMLVVRLLLWSSCMFRTHTHTHTR